MRIVQSFILFLFLNACVGEGAFEVPTMDIAASPIDPSQILSIGTLHAIWWQQTEGEGLYSLDDTYAEKYIVGYVISSDEAGNFYEELHLQDNYENPQKGIKILLDASPLFTRFNFGRKVYVQLKGLSLGMNKGVFSMGMASNNRIAPISEAQMTQSVIRDTLVATIVPRTISLGVLTPEMMNLFLRLEEVQFHNSQLMEGAVLTYAAEPSDSYDGERLLESCSDYGKLLVSTSTYADFNGMTLEAGKGFIDGIALFDYYGERMVFKVNDLKAVNLNIPERCDPISVHCEMVNEGSMVIWQEGFENYSDIEDLIQAGWSLTNPLNGDTTWKLDEFGGNTYMRISGYNSGELAIESWLIGPPIEMGGIDEVTLTFDLQTNYDNGAHLKLMVSGDYYQNPEMASWQLIDLGLTPGPYEGFGDNITIGPISLACFEGTIALAWVYEGSDPFKTTRFHIDNIKLKGS